MYALPYGERHDTVVDRRPVGRPRTFVGTGLDAEMDSQSPISNHFSDGNDSYLGIFDRRFI